jgi:hypothetical protein
VASKYTANAADLTMTAADTTNKQQIKLAREGDLILAHNTGGSPATVTITSSPDDLGRTGDITTYSLGAGEYAVFGKFQSRGWVQSDGNLYFEASSTDVKFGVIATG